MMAKYAAELASEGILTLSLSPGWVATNEVDPQVHEMTLKAFRNIDPQLEGRISSEHSVREQHETIGKLTAAHSGMFLSQHGNHDWF